MAHSTVNPTGLHDPRPHGYSHTAVVPAGAGLVLVAGQYASDEHGAVVAGDFEGQLTCVLDNLGTALRAHGLDLGDVVQLRTYVVDIDFGRLGALGAAIRSACGTPPPNTVVGVAALAIPEILVEVEAVAVTRG